MKQDAYINLSKKCKDDKKKSSSYKIDKDCPYILYSLLLSSKALKNTKSIAQNRVQIKTII